VRTTKELTLDKRQALERFFVDSERRALRMAQVATGNHDDALDIVQDAMMQLATRYSQRPSEQWAPLFYRVLQNRIKDWYRANSRRHKVFGFFRRDDTDDMSDPVAAHPERPGQQPDRLLQSNQSLTQLERAMQQLPQRQQQAVMLRLWEGLDVSQTADIMGCSAGSVKTHYSRAVHALRQQLGEHWP
jgi:RNA polymerase sigma-70 factor (ECF subfamily)